jgi:hypothetical protein
MKTTIERAYELARSGTCQNVKDIERQLQKEQHDGVYSHLQSGVLKKQLKAMILDSRAES